MFNNGVRALVIAIAACGMLIPASGQGPKNAATANDGTCGGPSGFGPRNWCAFQYSVSEQRQIQLLGENPQCIMSSRTVVHCYAAVTGNYGQIQLNRPNAARTGGGPNAASKAFAIPSTPPPLGVPPEQRAAADRLWERAVFLINQNRFRDSMPVLYQGALLGDRRAQATLGIRYQNGDGVKADDRAAAYWSGLAAAQGHRGAQYELAGLYLDGAGGLPKDLAKATDLLIKSANQGFDKAQLALGIAYEFGEGVPRNRAKAIALIRQSGEADEIASILANPRTPARFANEDAFAAYLRSLHNAQFAASWAQARASRGSWAPRYDPYFDHNSDYWKQRRWEERPH